VSLLMRSSHLSEYPKYSCLASIISALALATLIRHNLPHLCVPEPAAQESPVD
jgi:hypothetical protein